MGQTAVKTINIIIVNFYPAHVIISFALVVKISKLSNVNSSLLSIISCSLSLVQQAISWATALLQWRRKTPIPSDAVSSTGKCYLFFRYQYLLKLACKALNRDKADVTSLPDDTLPCKSTTWASITSWKQNFRLASWVQWRGYRRLQRKSWTNYHDFRLKVDNFELCTTLVVSKHVSKTLRTWISLRMGFRSRRGTLLRWATYEVRRREVTMWRW